MQQPCASAGARASYPFIVWVTSIFACVVCPAQNAPNELSTAEKWTVAQVAAGQIADLEQQFPNEAERKLSERFVSDLLTNTSGAASLSRRGVRIRGAIFDEPIDLSNARIPCDVSLTDCDFRKAV